MFGSSVAQGAVMLFDAWISFNSIFVQIDRNIEYNALLQQPSQPSLARFQSIVVLFTRFLCVGSRCTLVVLNVCIVGPPSVYCTISSWVLRCPRKICRRALWLYIRYFPGFFGGYSSAFACGWPTNKLLFWQKRFFRYIRPKSKWLISYLLSSSTDMYLQLRAVLK